MNPWNRKLTHEMVNLIPKTFSFGIDFGESEDDDDIFLTARTSDNLPFISYQRVA